VSTAIVPRSVAFNEGPNPQPMPWAEWFVCGPNTTPEQAQAIRAAGSKLIVKVQPVRVLLPNGEPDMYWPLGRALSLVPGLYCVDGTPSSVDAPGEGMAGRIVLDFSQPQVVHQMVKIVNDLCASLGAIGVMQDYGCKDVSGFGNCYKVDPNVWPAWGANYTAYLDGLMKQKRKVWRCCNKQFSPGAMLCMEGIRLSIYGGSDTGYPPSPKQAYNNCVAYPGTILLVETTDSATCSAIVSAAVTGGGAVDYRPSFFTGDRVSRMPAPGLPTSYPENP